MKVHASPPPQSPAPPPPSGAPEPTGSSDQITTLTPSTPTKPSSTPAPSQAPPSNPLIDRIKTVQSSLSSNPILRSISNKEGDENEPDNTKTHRSVGVDPGFYDMVDENVLSILLDACKPLFELVSGTDDPDSNPSTMKPADLLMITAKLIIAAGYKMKEQARQEMAEEDLGGGMFDQDVKNMREFAAKVHLPQVYDADELEALDKELALHEARGKGLRKYKTGTKLYTCQLADTGSRVDVRAEMEIRAPVEQVLGYYMGHVSQFNKHENDATKVVLGERRSDHSVFGKGRVPVPAPLHEREAVTRSLWKKLDDDSFLCSQVSCEHDEFPRRTGVVRMDFRRSYKLTRIGPKLTKLEVSGSVGMGGVIPRRIIDSVTIPRVLRSLASVGMYFTCVRSADAFDEGAGTVLGQLLFLELHPHRQNRDVLNEKTLDAIRMTNVLRSAQAKYRFFDEFLFHIIRNAMKRGAVQTRFTVKTPLVALTANEAGRIARSLVSILMANVTAEAAVDEHITTYPALGELEREYRWFRSMMEAIATELMNKVAYGVKARAALGAGVSFADMASDAYVVRLYFSLGRASTAYSLLAMVGANMLWQCFLVYVQTHGLKRDKWRTRLTELLAVVTFTKPGLDAYRVSSGAEMPPGALIALMKVKVVSKAAVASVFMSVASAALTATTQFYDSETDPGVKKRHPKWVGLVPDLGRGKAFAAVYLMCALQTLAKTAATALLALTNVSWLVVYFVADHLLLYAYLMVRRDFVWPILSLPPTFTYVATPVLRSCGKVISDFTGSLNMRLPLMCGGTYWLYNLAASQASVFVCVHLYNEHAVPQVDASGEDVAKATPRVLWTAAAGLTTLWVLTYMYFVFRIAVPKYRHTLWSWTSGRRMVIDYFLLGENDEKKFSVFGYHRWAWEDAIGKDVKAWTLANWERWNRDEPKWFTAATIAHVPDEFIPPRFLGGLGEAQRERRGSAAGSVRESFRLSTREGAEEDER
ncbi:hypothetical protein TeGR_g225 [Tetraparma gracilis]|uniref:Uncharacterized protein n=1 Tax=Tetraparma gracilis TaxID=2962635 RepID=A0ABQ6N892_9STRA|nr:hypothetical protein TeGR_g225 [Tetraparma gracilis]